MAVDMIIGITPVALADLTDCELEAVARRADADPDALAPVLAEIGRDGALQARYAAVTVRLAERE